ncbi:MAG TPA: hypothetical protein PLI62_00445 [Spirochaetota bacterium]|nr:hypothetical protein [Spirochaetota bacterium]
MITYIKLPDELYLKWLDYNAKRGVISSGRYAGIGKVNQDVFIRAINIIMEGEGEG